MMPKGVEHSSESIAAESWDTVRIPMMPKGVEHLEVLKGQPD